MAFTVSRIRSSYPALESGAAYLDGAAGTQVPRAVIDAIAAVYTAGVGNSGGAFSASQRSDEIVAAARSAVADLVGGSPEGVIFGPNMTTLTYRMAATLSEGWEQGDEVVVSRLDHDANVRPWVQAAERAGAQVRFAEVETATGTLPVAQYRDLVSERTKLVAVTAASNVLGTRPDVAAITDIAHSVGALSYVDGVHWTPHGPVDVTALGADFYATSAYKWSGPHIGAVIADPSLLEGLCPLKLMPSSNGVPARFEQGTLPFADLAGVVAAVEHLACLDDKASGSRRERLLTSMRAVQSYEASLFGRLLEGLGQIGSVTCYGAAADRAPTAYFRVEGVAPHEVASKLAERAVNVWSGDNYAWELVGVLGLRDGGGAVRAGIVHYNDESDVTRLLEGLAEIAR